MKLPRPSLLRRTGAALALLGGLAVCGVRAADAPAAPPPAAPQKYNVLLIMIDDLNAFIGSYGHKLAKTPNIDALAQRSVRFDKGYTQYPLCAPSRSSMLTGKYPITTGIYGNRVWFQDVDPTLVSLPRYFKDRGYVTLRSGKIFHGGIDDTDAWTVGGERRTLAGVAALQNFPAPVYARFLAQATPEASVLATATAPATPEAATTTPAPRGARGARGQRGGGDSQATLTGAQRSDRWVATEGDASPPTRAIELLRQYKDQPFFMGFGITTPHSPLIAPQRFFDLYNLDEIELPPDFAARPTVPAGFPEGSIRPRNADLFIGRDATAQQAKEMIHAYLACVSYTDWSVGRVLQELDDLGLREKTIVIFVSDHGFMLGGKGKWSKAGSLFELVSRVPFIIDLPGAKGNGQVSPRVVELLDIYPTLVELCGLPPAPGQQGHSLVPLLNDPQAPWSHPAFTEWSENGTNATGISVRTEKWRYSEYVLGGALLTDPAADPHELQNLVHDPQYAAVVAEHSALLKAYNKGVAFNPALPPAPAAVASNTPAATP